MAFLLAAALGLQAAPQTPEAAFDQNSPAMVLVLAALAAAIALYAFVIHRRRKAAPEAPHAVGEHVGPCATLVNEGAPPHVLAILSAAAFVAVGKQVRIRRVRPANAASAWAEAGRASIQTSHNIRRSL